MSQQSYEAGRYDPREADTDWAVDLVFPPSPGGVVSVGLSVVGVDQQVDVGNYHLLSVRRKSSTSSSSFS